jgi:RHS repeat-associated protein
MPGRSKNSDKARFAFNGMERNSEIDGGNYDFGARFYGAREGRWFSTDPYAEKYPALSPYNFVGNMPIDAVDPDGKKIKIVGGIKYRRWVMSTIRDLAKNSRTGRKLLRKAINSKDVILIHQNAEEDIGLRYKTSAEADGSKIARLTFNTNAGETLDASNGRGDKPLEQRASITLGHELQHFIDFVDGQKDKKGYFINPSDPVIEVDYGDYGTEKAANSIDADELSAVDTENKIRAEMGYELRTHYGGANVFNKEVSSKEQTFKDDGVVVKGKGLINKQKPTDYSEYAKNNKVLKHDKRYPSNSQLNAHLEHNYKKTTSNVPERGGFGGAVQSEGEGKGTTTIEGYNK